MRSLGVSLADFVNCTCDVERASTRLLQRMVARGGPIRKANQDSAAARSVSIGRSRSESIEPSMDNHHRNRLVLGLSVRDTRIFNPVFVGFWLYISISYRASVAQFAAPCMTMHNSVTQNSRTVFCTRIPTVIDVCRHFCPKAIESIVLSPKDRARNVRSFHWFDPRQGRTLQNRFIKKVRLVLVVQAAE